MGGKQKLVVRVPCCEKGRSIAFKTAARLPGLISVSLDGAEKDRVVVTGEEIDPCGLIKSLRKKVRCAELLTFGPVEEKKPPPEQIQKPQPAKEVKPIKSVPCSCQSVPCFCQTDKRSCPPKHVIYVCESCNREPICPIM